MAKMTITRARRETPPIRCAGCGRDMGRRTSARLLLPDRDDLANGLTFRKANHGTYAGCPIICVRCSRKSTISLHGKLYPACPVGWHDIWDHRCLYAKTPVLAWYLGLIPFDPDQP